MIRIVKRTHTGLPCGEVLDILADTEEDITALGDVVADGFDNVKAGPGSFAYTADMGIVYQLSPSREWKKAGGNSGGDSSGGSGGGWDAVITWARTDNMSDFPADGDVTLTASDGAYEKMMAKLLAGDVPNVAIMSVPTPEWEGAESYCGTVLRPVSIAYTQDLAKVRLFVIANTASMVLKPYRIDVNSSNGVVFVTYEIGSST